MQLLRSMFKKQTKPVSTEQETAWRQLVDDLDRLGFYKYAVRENVARIKAEATQRKFLFDDASGRGAYYMDAEDLAERLVDTFIQEISPFLKHEGIDLADITVQFEDGMDYIVTINSRS